MFDLIWTFMMCFIITGVQCALLHTLGVYTKDFNWKIFIAFTYTVFIVYIANPNAVIGTRNIFDFILLVGIALIPLIGRIKVTIIFGCIFSVIMFGIIWGTRGIPVTVTQ